MLFNDKSYTGNFQGKLEFKQGYGATETTSLTTSTLIGATDIDYSSCGMPLAHTEIMFLGSDGKPVPIGEVDSSIYY